MADMFSERKFYEEFYVNSNGRLMTSVGDLLGIKSKGKADRDRVFNNFDAITQRFSDLEDTINKNTASYEGIKNDVEAIKEFAEKIDKGIKEGSLAGVALNYTLAKYYDLQKDSPLTFNESFKPAVGFRVDVNGQYEELYNYVKALPEDKKVSLEAYYDIRSGIYHQELNKIPEIEMVKISEKKKYELLQQKLTDLAFNKFLDDCLSEEYKEICACEECKRAGYYACDSVLEDPDVLDRCIQSGILQQRFSMLYTKYLNLVTQEYPTEESQLALIADQISTEERKLKLAKAKELGIGQNYIPFWVLQEDIKTITTPTFIVDRQGYKRYMSIGKK